MLRRCLGPLALTAQAVGTVGLTLTAVFNIPQAMRSAGSATWISYGLALVLVLLIGYGATLLACLLFFGLFLEQLLLHVGCQAPPLLAYLLGGLGCLELARCAALDPHDAAHRIDLGPAHPGPHRGDHSARLGCA